MKLKETKYETIQIESVDESVVGEITIQNKEFIIAELFTTHFLSEVDIHEARLFLDIVEKKMKEGNITP